MVLKRMWMIWRAERSSMREANEREKVRALFIWQIKTLRRII